MTSEKCNLKNLSTPNVCADPNLTKKYVFCHAGEIMDREKMLWSDSLKKSWKETKEMCQL